MLWPGTATALLTGSPGPLSRRGGRVVRQRPAKPRTPVQFRSPPLGTIPRTGRLAQGESASLTRKRSEVQILQRPQRIYRGNRLIWALPLPGLLPLRHHPRADDGKKLPPDWRRAIAEGRRRQIAAPTDR
jgi:hypothetical protein